MDTYNDAKPWTSPGEITVYLQHGYTVDTAAELLTVGLRVTRVACTRCHMGYAYPDNVAAFLAQHETHHPLVFGVLTHPAKVSAKPDTAKQFPAPEVFDGV